MFQCLDVISALSGAIMALLIIHSKSQKPSKIPSRFEKSVETGVCGTEHMSKQDTVIIILTDFTWSGFLQTKPVELLPLFAARRLLPWTKNDSLQCIQTCYRLWKKKKNVRTIDVRSFVIQTEYSGSTLVCYRHLRATSR